MKNAENISVVTNTDSANSFENEVLELVNFDTTNRPRAYANAMVRFHHPFTTKERLDAAVKAGWNVFQFPSEMLQGGDFLSDSGTTTMTAEQFAAMFLGDEAYGTNWGYQQLLDQMGETFGLNTQDYEFYFFHQCRAAEHALFSHMKGDNLIVPNNSFFDTTRANAEANKIDARDLIYEDLKDDPNHPFKGNIHLENLEKLLAGHGSRVPLAYLTITNNTGGGQPVSMENIKAAKKICDKYDKPLFLDACRFAENAYFIQQREEGYKDKKIADIVRQEFAQADGFTISLKKDGLANMGGVLAVRKDSSLMKRYPTLLNDLRDHQILVEGHPTYGGLTGRDIMTINEGLKTVTQEHYLQGRVEQVQRFGNYLHELGIPVVRPFGGHAVYIDIDKFFEDTDMERGDFGGIALSGLLLLKGIRLCELGTFAFGQYDPKTGKETFPTHNYLRCAIPRNKYEEQDLKYAAECIKELYDRRHDIPKAVPTFGRDLSLRHFKARFELV
ncbi:MAG: tryptophanase [Alphaproteobacteria bacterium]|nr:tryptophanase [Alphaproteobacteria bacterium]